ncbi:MFS transporter [Georgenia daeguensis]|uniref:MFS transporter n=1 Tax=Georgenia daeguensis TaxID=908355 RepID=A0ABP8EU53_9MICO
MDRTTPAPGVRTDVPDRGRRSREHPRLDLGRDAPTTADRTPWAALLTLAGATFVVVTGEMLPTAVLPHLAADLDVPVARAGLLVSVWAATVVLASFPLVRMTARFDRRRVIAVALAVFAGGNLVTALAGSFALAAGSRVVAAGATGLLWATVNAHSAALVPEHRIARAASVVLGGGTLGTVLAVPAGNAVAALWGWRPVFVGLTVLALLASAAVLTVLAPAPRSAVGGGPTPAGRRPLRPLVVLAGLGGLVLAAHFAAFTFVTALIADRGTAVPASALLLLFGLLGAAGVVLVGRVGDRYPHGTGIAVAALVAASLAALALLGLHPALDVVLFAVWGASTGAVGPAVQTAMMRTAGAEHRDTAGTLLPVAFNLGIALGAAVGSAVVEGLSLGQLPPLATALAVLATVGLAAAGRRDRRGRIMGPARVRPAPRSEEPCPA